MPKIIKEVIDGVEVEQTYYTQEELAQAEKSANSKGKGEILKELNSTSIKEIQEKLKEKEVVVESVKTFEQQLKEVQEQLKSEKELRVNTEYKNAALKHSVREDVLNDVINLAKLEQSQDIDTRVKAVVDRLGLVKESPKPLDKVGTPKGENKVDDGLAKAEQDRFAELRKL